MTKQSEQLKGKPCNSKGQKVIKKKPIRQPQKKARSGRPTKKISKQLKNRQQSSPDQSLGQESQQNFIVEAGIQIIHKYIDFFSEINEKKGFVFKSWQRKQFSQSLAHIQFTEESKWCKQIEFSKISNLCQRYNCDSQILKDLMLQSSTIFAQEFTYQHYLIILKIYNIISEGFSFEKQKDALVNLARRVNENLDGQFLFFSLVYKAQIKTRYSRPEILPYQKLVKEISTIMKSYIIESEPNNKGDLFFAQ